MTPGDACRAAADMLDADPDRRHDLNRLLAEATGLRWSSLILRDVHQAVHHAVCCRYQPARVWVSDDLWAALPDTDPADVSEMLRSAGEACDAALDEGMTLGLALARYYGNQPRSAARWEVDHGDVVQRECDRADGWVDAHG